MPKVFKISSISQLHKVLHYEAPKHPLITLIDFSGISLDPKNDGAQFSTDFYAITLKKMSSGGFLYGRKDYDFDEAAMLCTAPGQSITVSGIDENWGIEGWGLFFHPDLIRNSFLSSKIKDYSFFTYSENEALHLSETENKTLQSVIDVIQHEYSLNLDHFSRDLIISNIEVLLNYCKRFYGRQFITRSGHHHDVLVRFEALLKDYFQSDQLRDLGLPTVKYCADKLAFSANYLSDLLKQESGKTSMEHIHYYLIEKAKDLLADPSLSISDVAYDLGFEQP
jgi:AraC-like DNA-binding protein